MAGASMPMSTPSSLSTSALPQRLETERLPCLATVTPAPAATNAARVEMLKVCAPSPPVPQVSTTVRPAGRGTRVAFSLMTVAAAAISSTLSPLSRRAVSRAPIWACVASPDMMSRMAASISARARSLPSTALAIAALRSAAEACLRRSRKFSSSLRPTGVAMDSGWNCTPSTSKVLCLSAMISPSAVQALTVKQSGRLWRSTAKLW